MDNKFRYNKKDNTLVQVSVLQSPEKYYENCIRSVPANYKNWHEFVNKTPLEKLKQLVG